MAHHDDDHDVKLSIRLFGGPQLTLFGEPISSTRTKKDLWTLALLALRYNNCVPIGNFTDVLWPASSPQNEQYLSRSISFIKSALKTEKYRIEGNRKTGYYRFNVDGALLDLEVFDKRVSTGTVQSLKEALKDFSRGPLLRGWDSVCNGYQSWVTDEIKSRKKMLSNALVSTGTRLFEEQKTPDAYELFQSAIGLDALDEAAVRGKLRCLEAYGSKDEVISTYRELMEFIHDSKGSRVDPDEETTLLYGRIIKRLNYYPQPLPRPTVLRRSPPPNNIPCRNADLFEIDDKIADIFTKLKRRRTFITLTGLGGVGKTQLAYAVARHACELHWDEYPHGVWVFSLKSVKDLKGFLQVIASGLGVKSRQGRRLEELILAHVENRRMLLIFDNCDYVKNETSDFIATLTKQCKYLNGIATCRTRLGSLNEKILQVLPLTFPTYMENKSLSSDVSKLSGFGSVQLFLDRALLKDEYFVMTPENAHIIWDICRRLNGIPLAIELAAAHVRERPLSEIAKIEASEEGGIREILMWTLDQISTEMSRQLFASLSVFEGIWDLDAATAVCQPLYEIATDRKASLVDHLEDLVESGLIGMRDGDVYHMLPVIREYALELLIGHGHYEDLMARHRDHYLAWVIKHAHALEAVDEYYDNIVAALDWNQTQKTPSRDETEAVVSFSDFLVKRGQLDVAQERLTLVLSRVKSDEPSRGRMNVLKSLGHLSMLQNRLDEAESYFQKRRKEAEALHDNMAIAYSLNELAWARLYSGGSEEAIEYWRQGHERFLVSGKDYDVALSFIRLGDIKSWSKDYTGAADALQKCLILLRPLEAEKHQNLIAVVLNSLGSAIRLGGDPQRARHVLEEARAIAERRKLLGTMANALRNIAETFVQEDDLSEGRRYFERSLEMYIERSELPRVAELHMKLGHIDVYEEKFSEAHKSYKEALSIYSTLDDKRQTAYAASCLGFLNLAHELDRYAARNFWSSIRTLLPMRDESSMAFAMAGLARVAFLSQEPQQAALLMGWSELHLHRRHVEFSRLDKHLVNIRTPIQLEDLKSEYPMEWEKGTSFSLEQAVQAASELAEVRLFLDPK